MKKSALRKIIREELLMEGLNNTLILDTIDDVHTLIKLLKKDKTLDQKLVNKLYVTAGPFISMLHKLVK